MNAALLIYFAGVSGNFQGLIGFSAATLAIASVFLFMGFFIEESEVCLKLVKFTLPLAFILGLTASLIPNQTTILLMAGAKVTEDIVTSPDSKEIGGKILKIINQKLDEQVKK